MAFDTIVVADSDGLSRIGLKSILEGSEAVGPVTEAASFSELDQLFQVDSTDILVTDVHLSGLRGHTGLNDLMSRYPGLRICVLLESVTREIVSQYLGSGVMGCIEKARAAEEVVDAITTISSNRPYLSKLDDNKALPTPNPAIPGNLTRRQRKVIAVMAMGKSNKEIARELGICEGTVKVHVNAAYRALGVHNRVAAVTVLRKLTERGAQENGAPLQLAV